MIFFDILSNYSINNLDFIVHLNLDTIKDIIFFAPDKSTDESNKSEDESADEPINYSEKLLATLIRTGTIKVINEFI